MACPLGSLIRPGLFPIYIPMLNSANPLPVLSHGILSPLLPYVKRVFTPLHMACFMQQR